MEIKTSCMPFHCRFDGGSDVEHLRYTEEHCHVIDTAADATVAEAGIVFPEYYPDSALE